VAKFVGHGFGTQKEDNERARAKVKAEAKTTGDPSDHSVKVRVSGQTLGERGTSMRGHAAALRGLRTRPIRW
jgi:hypothetical protein